MTHRTIKANMLIGALVSLTILGIVTYSCFTVILQAQKGTEVKMHAITDSIAVTGIERTIQIEPEYDQ
jgi:hypothetical protein